MINLLRLTSVLNVSRMHVFSDLKPYICTVDSCPSELTQFPTRKLWEAHEFNEHRTHRTWCCPFCPESYNSPKDLKGHLPSKHDHPMSTLQMHQLIKNAEIKTKIPVENHVCPLCGVIPGKSQRNFATHLGQHMETIALAVLPPATEDESDGDSIGSTSDNRSVKSRVRLSAVKKDSSAAPAHFLCKPSSSVHTEWGDSYDQHPLSDSENLENSNTDRFTYISKHPRIIDDELGPRHSYNERDEVWRARVSPSLATDFHLPPQASSDTYSQDLDRYRTGSATFSTDISSPYLSMAAFYSQTTEAGPLPMSSSLSRYYSPRSVSIGFGEEGKERGRCPNPDCGKLFKDLKAHMLTHLSERPEKCPITTCDYRKKGFARKYDKQRHVLTHYKGTMVCGFCPGSGSTAEKSFNRADVFKRHLTSVHGVEQSPPNSQKKSFIGLTKDTTSQRSDTATGKCSTCGTTFNNAQDYYEHLDECVLRVVQQGDEHKAINERLLATVANDDAVQETLARNMLPSGLESANKHKESLDQVEGAEDGEDAQDGSNFGGDLSKLHEESDVSPSSSNMQNMTGIRENGMSLQQQSVMPENNNRNGLIQEIIDQHLQQQPTRSGWWSAYTPQNRSEIIFRIISSLRVIKPETSIQQIMNVALRFERKAFDNNQDKVHFPAKVTSTVF